MAFIINNTPYLTFFKLLVAKFGYHKKMSFGDNLHKELEFQDIQIKELSEKTGISKNTLDKYLSGAKSQPNVENAVKIAQALGVTVEYLVLGKTFTKPEPSDTFQNSFSKLNSRDREIIMDLIKIIAKRM